MKCLLIIAFHIVLCTADPIPFLPSLNPLTPNGRIVGGEPTTIEEFPYQVSLQVNGFHFCGGSILSKDYIITAGHCAAYPANWITVHMGSTRTTGGDIHEVEKITRHEDYSTNMYGIPINDVSVMRLKKPITFDATKQPVTLFNQQEEAVEDVMTTITGWGAIREGGSAPEILQKVHVPIVSKPKCTKAYQSYGGVPKGQICAAYPEGGKDTCQGDSGGPLTIDGRLAGIVSWGNGCARPRYPGVYTEVASYHDWIVKHAEL